jgi:hypothetical protein
VIVDGYVTGRFGLSSPRDTVRFSFSRDGNSWIPVATICDSGEVRDTVWLTSVIATKELPALRDYLLKVTLVPGDSASFPGIDSLEQVTEFQISRAFLPRLRRGENHISYSDAVQGARNVTIDLQWTESSEREPPHAVSAGVFPEDGADVDSLQFTVEWQPATSSGEAVIADYEFVLSDRADMKYPLSSTFRRYCSADGEEITPRFRIPHPGLLNDGTRYYWRVRAKDSYGVWGTWSATWSFVPHGVMPPVDPVAELSDGKVVLRWSRNPGGAQPAGYVIHASDESNGFIPDASTLLHVVSGPADTILTGPSTVPKTYYRIVAVGADGRPSGPSGYAMLPYPVVTNAPEEVRPGETFMFTPRVNRRFTPAWVTNAGGSGFLDTLDTHARIESLAAPSWLHVDPVTQSITGTPDALTLGRMLYDASVRTIAARIAQDGVPSAVTSIVLRSSYRNHAPTVPETTFVSPAVEGVEFRLHAADADTAFGDTIRLDVIAAPSWAAISRENASLVVRALPGLMRIEDTVLVVEVVDGVGATTSRRVPVSLRHPMRPPRFDTVPPGEATQESLYVYASHASDPDSAVAGDYVRYRLVTHSAWLQIDSLTGLLRGTPKQADVRNEVVCIEARDNLGQTARQEIALSVRRTNHRPVVVVWPSSTATEDAPYHSQIHAEDADSAVFQDSVHYVFAGRPGWMSIDSTTGRLTGTPRIGDVGDSSMVILVYDRAGATVRVDCPLRVAHVNHPPEIVSLPVTAAWEDTPYSSDLLAGDRDSTLDGGRLHYRAHDAPSWLQVDSVRGVLSGTPGPEDVGEVLMRVEVRDDSGAVAREEFRLRTIHRNHAPTVVLLPDTEAVEEQPYRSRIAATDRDSSWFHDSPRYRLAEGPMWLSVDSLGGLLTGTAPLGECGGVAVVVEVVDDSGSVVRIPLRLAVQHVNHQPSLATVGKGGVTATEHLPFVLAVEPVDPDIPHHGDSLSVQLLAGPQWLLLDPSGAKLTGVPPEGAVDTVAVLRVSDGALSDTALLAIHVVPVNDPPRLAHLEPISLDEDTSVSISLDPFVSDPDNTRDELFWRLALADEAGPAGAGRNGTSRGTCGKEDDRPSLVVASASRADSLVVAVDVRTRILTVCASHNFHGSEIPVLLTVLDRGGLGATDTFMVTVRPVNDPVVLQRPPEESKTFVDLLFSLPIECHDPDGPDSLIRYRWSGPEWLGVSSSGRLEGRPRVEGTYAGMLYAADGEGGVDSVLVRVCVRPNDEARDLTTGVPQEFVLKQNYPNPFNPSTTIRFGVPVASTVSITVYTALGQRLVVLADGARDAGYHEVLWAAAGLSSGMYLVEMNARGVEDPSRAYRSLKKVILQK